MMAIIEILVSGAGVGGNYMTEKGTWESLLGFWSCSIS